MGLVLFGNSWVNVAKVDYWQYSQAGSVFYVSAFIGATQFIGTKPYSSLADTNAAIGRILSGNLSEINV